MNAVTLANESSRFKKVLLATLVTSALTACGGGGGGGAAPPPTPPPPVNRSPTANAGTDFNVDENSNSALAGSGTDSDGTISTYLWVQTAGPTVSLSSTSAAAPTFVTPDVDSDTTLSFTLTVTDDDGLEASDSVDVTIINIPDPNVAPTANAGPDFEINEEQNTALDGSGTDTDGTISAYLWAQTAGPAVTLSSTTVAAPTFVSPQVDLDTLLSFTLTVTDDGGLTATDSVDVNVLDVVDVNAPPIAKAGTDSQGVIGQSVTLDASGSSDADGTISTYQWSQVDNGAPILSLSAATTASPSLTIPDLADNIEFEFQLTVTDDDGDSATDNVIVIGRPIPSINVGKVVGNTANVNALAQFSVSMASRPLAEVSIGVSSSDTLEGIPEQSALIFTQENWDIPQLVSVYGQNPNVVDGEQNYAIQLAATSSTDSLYNGLDPDDVVLNGVELVIETPSEAFTAFPKVPFIYRVEPTYTGNNPLTFSLSSGPDGMTIDFNTGVITWQPPTSLNNSNVTADITVNDGNRFASVTYNFNVPQTRAVAANYEPTEAELTIDESDSNLNGVRLKQVTQGDALSAVTMSKVDMADMTNTPTGVMKLTDGLIINDPVTQEVDIRFALSDLPEGVALDDIRFYTYGETSENEEPVWSIGGFQREFSGTEEAPFVTFRFAEMPPIGFFGYKVSDGEKPDGSSLVNPTLQMSSSLYEAALASEVTCVQQTFFRINIDEFDCTSTAEPGVTITVEDWGNSALRWTSVSKEQIVSWLIDARSEFTLQNLGFDDEFVVRIETMDDPRTLGFVNSREDYKVLHITDLNTKAATTIQGTSVHEYYHHAQGHPDSQLENKSLVIEGGTGIAWLYEGTARWVEDVIFDEINSYKRKEGRGTRFLEVGLKTGYGDGKDRPYQRFSLFKLLDEKCPTMNETMQDVFNHTPDTDALALNNLTSLLSNMGCDFGDHFESDKSATLAAALSFYNVATQFKNDMSSLDANEPSTGFSFDKPSYRFSPALGTSLTDIAEQPESVTYTLQNVALIKSAGAVSFEVPALLGEMPEGKVAEILVQSTSRVYVSIASNDAGFVSTNTIDDVPHTWFDTSLQSSFIYGEGVTNLPKLFVTLVNADEESDATVNVTFTVRDELSVDTLITSHTSGENVDDRVVSIVGSIPAEGRDFTNDVHITANGITTVVPMSSGGAFEGSVVMSLGANNVKAQGFNGNTPTTREEIITLNGIEAGSTRVNALIASRVVFVLRWDTSTDIDIYSKDPLDETIWYSDRTATLGSLDRDDTSGFGPEVVSYRADGNSAYSNGQFDVDVHYYSGSPSTNYTVDVILNETEGSNRRNYQFSSTTPLTVSSSSDSGVDDTGDSRFNDILFISCNAARVCGLSSFDSTKLSLSSGFGTGGKRLLEAGKGTGVSEAGNSCEETKAIIAEKYGFTPQSCDDEIMK